MINENEIGQNRTDILDLIELGAFRWLDDSPIDRRWWWWLMSNLLKYKEGTLSICYA